MKFLSKVVAGAALTSLTLSANAVVINEIQPNPPGADPSTVTVELMGMAGDSFSGWLLSIESDSISGLLGVVESASMISGVFDVNGLLTADIDDLENPSFTLVLVDSFTGTIGTTDIDVNNDGIVDDASSFTNLLDAIGVPDSPVDEAFVFGSDLGGVDFSYTGDEPQLIFRDGTTLDWYAINDPAGTDAFDLGAGAVPFTEFDTDPSATTFGAVNPTRAAVVSGPAAIWLLASAIGLPLLRGRGR